MRHWSGDVAAALCCYEKALSLRRELASLLIMAELPEPSVVAQQLDLVVSLVKVADAQLALEYPAQAELLLVEARQLAEGVAVVANPDDRGLMAKLKGVQAHLNVHT